MLEPLRDSKIAESHFRVLGAFGVQPSGGLLGPRVHFIPQGLRVPRVPRVLRPLARQHLRAHVHGRLR
eukprot:2902488-Alexandrium_andersonii.AAC.1